MNKKYYSAREVGRYFHISPKMVYKLIEGGKIRCIKIERAIRISVDEIIRYENEMEKEQN